MSNLPLKTFESPSGRTYVLPTDQQTTAADITSLHNLIAQLLVDDYIETESKQTTA